jgi:GNAT superfamily N-acetyltransferase
MSSSSDSATIRLAVRTDVPALGRFGAELMRLHFDFDHQRFMTPPADAVGGYGWFLGNELGDPKVVVLVAEQEGRVVGYAYAGLEPLSWKELRGPAGFIHDVIVAEDARGQGIATLLVEAAARWLEEHGAPRVMLWTASLNEPARRLFAGLGFRPTMIEMTREARVPSAEPGATPAPGRTPN